MITQADYIALRNRIFLEIAIIALGGLVANDEIVDSRKKVEIMELFESWRDRIFENLQIKED